MKQHIKLYEEYNKTTQLFTTKKEIEDWFDENNLNMTYTIDDNLCVRVFTPDGENNPDYVDGDNSLTTNDDLILYNLDIERLPVKFLEVDGLVAIEKCVNLKTLEGCPKRIWGSFYCTYNESLKVFDMPEGFTIGNELYVQNGGFRTFLGLNDGVTIVPTNYDNNPCSHIYHKFGFTDEGHIESLIHWAKDEREEVIDFLKSLENKNSEYYNKLMDMSKELRIMMGMESEELTDAYKTSKNVEGDFY